MKMENIYKLDCFLLLAAIDGGGDRIWNNDATFLGEAGGIGDDRRRGGVGDGFQTVANSLPVGGGGRRLVQRLNTVAAIRRHGWAAAQHVVEARS